MLVFASFPHLGVDHDSKIWKTSVANGLMTFVDGEWILGDPAYIGCPHCATKYVLPTFPCGCLDTYPL